MATLHSTDRFHREDIETLGWELTVSNALDPPESPCRRYLKGEGPYGARLLAWLRRWIPLDRVDRVLEVGGGYGYLMRDLLAVHPFPRVTMLDISPFLLNRQREALRAYPSVRYVEADFLAFDAQRLGAFDWIILNENLGDFPTVVGWEGDVREDPDGGAGGEGDSLPARVRRLHAAYSLAPPSRTPFNFNLGAVEALEKICRAGVPCVFLAEHSCEAAVPEPYRRWIDVRAGGNPERIALKGHDEYTIRFSNLVAVAAHYGYEVLRGPVADFLQLDFSPELESILRARNVAAGERETVRQFVEDLFQYEYLLLRKRGIEFRVETPPKSEG
ncbi:MAG TPA: class I SAM-dependent methyltransferase [Syntrophales bacterium]|nr:class I SAM-dependent methyltransferase [Syntrophales bacterium]